MMRTPGFWYKPSGLLSGLLTPLGWLYGYGTKRRLMTGERRKLSVPVICIGNINAGGTGKTPTVIALVEHLKAKGLKPQVVSRGYGGQVEGVTKVVEAKHSAEDVGDEPLLLSAFTDVWVSKDRSAGADAALDAGANVIILDDGFQNPALFYDLSIVVVDAIKGFGNRNLIPAGPLREPVKVGLERAEALLSIGPSAAQAHFAQTNADLIKLPHIKGKLTPLQTGMIWSGARVLAFAGIGHPEKFFATLKALGADVVKSEPLEDHQPLSQPLMTRLQAEARALNAQLVTTEKDAVRLPPDFKRDVLSVPVRLEIENLGVLDHLLEDKQITKQRR